MSQGFTQSLPIPLAVSKGGTGNSTGSLASMNNLPATAFPVGTQFNIQQGKLTSNVGIVAVATWTDTTVTVTITPTSASNTVNVRAVVNYQVANNNDFLMFRLMRGSTAIGVGDTAGSRTLVTSFNYINAVGGGGGQSVMEWVDSPATGSATIYKVQCYVQLGTTIYINSTVTDVNSAAYPRSVSTITVSEVKV